MTRPVRVYQEDWWPFRNLPNALERFERETGIKTELVWDKAGVGLIGAMFDQMIRSFTTTIRRSISCVATKSCCVASHPGGECSG